MLWLELKLDGDPQRDANSLRLIAFSYPKCTDLNVRAIETSLIPYHQELLLFHVVECEEKFWRDFASYSQLDAEVGKSLLKAAHNHKNRWADLASFEAVSGVGGLRK